MPSDEYLTLFPIYMSLFVVSTLWDRWLHTSITKSRLNTHVDYDQLQVHFTTRYNRNEQQGHLFKICVSAHVAFRMLLALSQPVNCIFWPIKTLNWMVAASKLHKHKGSGYTAEWPSVYLLYCGAVLGIGYLYTTTTTTTITILIYP